MLSRTAESFYWLNRYIERAENIARFIDINLNLILDFPTNKTQQWQSLIETTGELQLFQERYGEATTENVIRFLSFDHDCSHSIVSCLQVARENARTIRQFISRETWQQVNTFYLMVKQADPDQSLAKLPEFFSEVKTASYLFTGVVDATMSHNEGWHFGKIGRLLERANQTSRILNVKYFTFKSSTEDASHAHDEIGWISLLKLLCAYEMYRQQYSQHRVTSKGVVEFLISDQESPRAIQFCLLEVKKSLEQIIDTSTRTGKNPAQQVIGELCSRLDNLTVEETIQSGLDHFLEDLQRQINEVNDNIIKTFFALEPTH